MADPTTGRFGRFGGRFVPETLVPALRRARGGVPRRVGRPGLPGRARRPAARLRRAGPSPLTECAPPVRAARRPGAAQARGPQPHRQPQDQQRARPGAARPAHGQAPAHRRDRRRPARRGHRHGRRPARPGVRGLHGRGRHGAPGAQRVPHAPARRRGAPGHHRQPHAEGRGQRGHARLGGHRRVHPLLPRLGDGAAPVPVDGPGVPPGDRRRGPRAVPGAARRRDPDVVVACVGGGSNAAGIFCGFGEHRAAPSCGAPSRPAAPPSATACPASCTA